MGKKERMLNLITKNIDGFMLTSTSVEVIPYTELSLQTFKTAKKYFANDVEFDSVVCLISTSVLAEGKCGILFTTDYVYSKAWGGIFTGTYKNAIAESESAEFGRTSEVDETRMRRLMAELYDIAAEEDKRESQSNTANKVGAVIGTVGLVGMAVIEALAEASNSIVEQNCGKIAQCTEATFGEKIDE